MRSEDTEVQSWTSPLVRQYFQTAAGGAPYIACPDELRPASASPDSWWVIYCPNFDGGVIVEGYKIDEWRDRQRTFATLWTIAGLVSYYVAIQRWEWFLAFLIVWISGFFVGGYLLGRSSFGGRTWVAFPQELQEALRTRGDLNSKANIKTGRKEAISDAIGRVAGAVSGLLVEAAAGKGAAKVSEMAVEAACKALARQIMKHD